MDIGIILDRIGVLLSVAQKIAQRRSEGVQVGEWISGGWSRVWRGRGAMFDSVRRQESRVDKRARTDSPSKSCGGGRTVIKVTFFLIHFSRNFEFFLEGF